MINKYMTQAKAEYFCNVDEFIGTGEGRELSRQENLKIRTAFPEFEMWYGNLDQQGKERIDSYLKAKYGQV